MFFLFFVNMLKMAIIYIPNSIHDGPGKKSCPYPFNGCNDRSYKINNFVKSIIYIGQILILSTN